MSERFGLGPKGGHHNHHDGLIHPAPSPSPVASLQYPSFIAREIFFFNPFIPVPNSSFDISAISIVAFLLIFSLTASFFVSHLIVRSRKARHLREFNSLWIVRFLLIGFASLWAVNETLRLPFVRRKHLYQFLPHLTLKQQTSICKLHTVLSLGLLEPGFFITLLFLIKFSIKKPSPSRMWAVATSVIILCCPITLMQVIVVYFSNSLESRLPKFMHGSYIVATDLFGHEVAFCTYPFLSSVVFVAFVIAYAMVFLLSCWHVMEFVINKGIRRRISFMVVTVMVVLPLQILCLSLSWLWMPGDVVYGYLVTSMCLFVAWCMVVGEVILVIKPIRDALVEDREQGSSKAVIV